MSLVIKKGQTIGTYNTAWYAIFTKIIRLVTGAKIDHVMKVMDVRHNKHGWASACFIFETRLSTNSVAEWVTFEDFAKRLKKCDVYIGDPMINPTESDFDEAMIFVKQNKNASYGVANTVREIGIINKIARFLGIKRNDEPFCSVLCAKVDSVLYNNGSKILSGTDGYPSPIEYKNKTQELGIFTWHKLSKAQKVGFLSISEK